MARLRASCIGRRDKNFGRLCCNYPIAFLQDNYIVLVICCLLNMQYMSWHNRSAQINSGLAVALFTLLVFYPLVMQRFLYLSHDKLDTVEFKRKFGHAYDYMNTKNRRFTLYQLIYFYRRLIVPISVIYFPAGLMIQIGSLIVTSLAQLAVLTSWQPLSSARRNRSEILKQLSMTLVAYFLMCFTAWVDDYDVRYVLGYIIICLLLCQLLYSVVTLCWEFTCSQKNKCMKRRAKALAKKNKNMKIHAQIKTMETKSEHS